MSPENNASLSDRLFYVMTALLKMTRNEVVAIGQDLAP